MKIKLKNYESLKLKQPIFTVKIHNLTSRKKVSNINSRLKNLHNNLFHIIKETWRIFTYSSSSEKNYRATIQLICLVISSVACFTFYQNLIKEHFIIAGTCMFFIVSGLVFFFVLMQWNAVKFVLNFYTVLFMICYSLCFVKGYNNGFAGLWVVIFPFLPIILGGTFQSLVLGSYFFVFVTVCLWTPVKNSIFPYSSEFCSLFPVLFGSIFIFSLCINYRIQKENIAQDNFVKIKQKHIEELAFAVEKEKLYNQHLSFTMINSMIKALESRDEYTKDHSMRVAELSRKTALKMGCSRDFAKSIYRAGLVHDIGKIGIRDSILYKKNAFDSAEYATIKKHPEIGFNILKESFDDEVVLNGVLFHHERFNGSGYPEGLCGESIPLVARILCVADSFDAMNSNRVYRQAMTEQDIFNELKKYKGVQFDPQILDAFIEMLETDRPDFLAEEAERTEK